MHARAWWPVAGPIAVAGAASTGLAIVVNLATGDGPWWMWMLVAALTVAGIATSIWMFVRQQSATRADTHSVDASGERSVAVGGDVGWVATGDNASAPPTTPPVASRTAVVPASVSAGGSRSVAVGGNAGSISVGDRTHPAAP